MRPPDYQPFFASLRLEVSKTANVLAAVVRSDADLRRARQALGKEPKGVAAFALGSLARFEASSESDLDLAFLYDSSKLSFDEAEVARKSAAHLLRDAGFDVSDEKTFDRAWPVDSMVFQRLRRNAQTFQRAAAAVAWAMAEVGVFRDYLERYVIL